MSDIFLYELGLYIFILGLVVQSLYRIFDPLIDVITGKKKEDKEEKKEELKTRAIIPEDEYLPPFPSFDRFEKKPPTWKDLIIPPILGLLVAYIFWPLTIFDYLPFQPQFPIISYIITSLVISRVANAEHDSFKTIGHFFMGVISRVYPYK